MKQTCTAFTTIEFGMLKCTGQDSDGDCSNPDMICPVQGVYHRAKIVGNKIEIREKK